jgi:hypothetical protein
MNDLFAALALLLVLEGILPFLAPARWREMIMQIGQMSDQQLRWVGLCSMALGLILLTFVRAASAD